jgi:PhnB protein
MTRLTPYLLFDGNCLEAMQFYRTCFGGELSATKVKDSPAKDQMPLPFQDRILNARLKQDNIEISASDWLRPDRARVRGNSVCLYLSGGTYQEMTVLFQKLSEGADVTDLQKLSEGADVTDPLKQMFFGTYGALNDRFGVRWMFVAAREQ